MGYAVHRRVIEDRPVYRIWSTFVDRYVTPTITREEVATFFMEEARVRAARETEQVLKLADERNTSSRMEDPSGEGDPWHTEMCSYGRFHHAFVPPPKRHGNLRGLCQECDEVEENHAHLRDCGRRG